MFTSSIHNLRTSDCRDAASNYLRKAGEVHGTVEIQISIGKLQKTSNYSYTLHLLCYRSYCMSSNMLATLSLSVFMRPPRGPESPWVL